MAHFGTYRIADQLVLTQILARAFSSRMQKCRCILTKTHNRTTILGRIAATCTAFVQGFDISNWQSLQSREADKCQDLNKAPCLNMS